jgi:hypothetical protein
MKAISIQQPWAWAIIAGHKTIENRTWSTSYRGPLLIHAGQKLSKSGYDRLLEYGAEFGFKVPPPTKLLRGGIIGRVRLVDVVVDIDDSWFLGPYGWIFSKPRRMTFTPVAGKLKLFEV